MTDRVELINISKKSKSTKIKKSKTNLMSNLKFYLIRLITTKFGKKKFFFLSN